MRGVFGEVEIDRNATHASASPSTMVRDHDIGQRVAEAIQDARGGGVLEAREGRLRGEATAVEGIAIEEQLVDRIVGQRVGIVGIGVAAREAVHALGQQIVHAVLAYGYDWEPESARVDLHIYDPDYSGRDDITLTFHLSGPERDRGIVNSTGASVRGFFHTSYRPPGFAWFSYLFGLHN